MHEKTVALAIFGLELRDHVFDAGVADRQRRVGAFVAQVKAPDDANPLPRKVLRFQLLLRQVREPLEGPLQRRHAVRLQSQLDGLLAHRHGVGQPHAVRREHARERVDGDPSHSERIGDQAGVLARGAAEATQGVRGDVVPALHRDLLDRFGHVAHGDLDETLSDLFRAARVSGRATDLRHEDLEFGAHGLAVQRRVALRSEHRWKESRLDLAEHDVCVGHGERPAPAVARGPRIGPRRLGAHAVARPVEMQDRSAAGGDGMDAHHRRAHAYARDLPLERPLELSRVMGNVGRRAAHVEGDDPVEARSRRGSHGADHPCRRPG